MLTKRSQPEVSVEKVETKEQTPSFNNSEVCSIVTKIQCKDIEHEVAKIVKEQPTNLLLSPKHVEPPVTQDQHRSYAASSQHQATPNGPLSVSGRSSPRPSPYISADRPSPPHSFNLMHMFSNPTDFYEGMKRYSTARGYQLTTNSSQDRNMHTAEIKLVDTYGRGVGSSFNTVCVL